MTEFNLSEFDRLLAGGELAPERKAPGVLPIGARVEITRMRPLRPGSLIGVVVGDTGTIVRVGGTAYALDLGGFVVVVRHEDVAELETS